MDWVMYRLLALTGDIWKAKPTNFYSRTFRFCHHRFCGHVDDSMTASLGQTILHPSATRRFISFKPLVSLRLISYSRGTLFVVVGEVYPLQFHITYLFGCWILVKSMFSLQRAIKWLLVHLSCSIWKSQKSFSICVQKQHNYSYRKPNYRCRNYLTALNEKENISLGVLHVTAIKICGFSGTKNTFTINTF